MQRIYSILTKLLGESKQGGYDKNLTQYQFNCPRCADEKGGIDNKYNLEISFSLGKFHCWSCNDSGNLSKLIKQRGNIDLLNEYFHILKEIKESEYYDLTEFNDKDDEIKVLQLPKTFTPITSIENCPDNLKKYLDKRKIDAEIINKFNLGYTTWDEEKWQMRNRLIIPSYNKNGDLNYWVGRDYTENPKKLKYMNCDADKEKIIFQESTISYDADIILVEGAIDALYGNNIIALLGKVLSKESEIFKKITEKANAKIIIILDDDTKISEVKRIYKILNYGRLKDMIWYARTTPFKDFGEAYEKDNKNGIINILKNIKQFSELELIF